MRLPTSPPFVDSPNNSVSVGGEILKPEAPRCRIEALKINAEQLIAFCFLTCWLRCSEGFDTNRFLDTQVGRMRRKCFCRSWMALSFSTFIYAMIFPFLLPRNNESATLRPPWKENPRCGKEIWWTWGLCENARQARFGAVAYQQTLAAVIQ